MEAASRPDIFVEPLAGEHEVGGEIDQRDVGGGDGGNGSQKRSNGVNGGNGEE
jgi:hypothetical protein